MPTPITPWVTRTKPVVDGEEVKALIANRHPLELQQRTQHLKDRLDALDAGQALIARNVAISSDVKIAHAVYWDAVEQRYKPALAKLEFNSMLGGFVTAPSSYVVGICAFKYSSNRADIIMSGLGDSIDFTFGIGTAGDVVSEAGAYYLSANQAGMYTKQQPPVGVFVAYLRGDGSAHIMPTPRELLEQHIHYAVELFAQPAGTIACATPPNGYSFIAADPSQPGWLPANDPTFSGLAPAGAVFGYNLGMHPELYRLWPPLPPETLYMEINGIGVENDTFMADIHGLWWFKNCYGKAPWPSNPACGPAPSSSLSSSSSSMSSMISLLCEPGSLLDQMGYIRNDPNVKRIKIFFTKMVMKDNLRSVTSLAPYPGSPIQVLGCDGNPANRGDLKLALNLSGNITEDNVDYRALKNIPSGFNFTRGYVLTGLRAGSANVNLTIPDSSKGREDPSGVFHGEVAIDVPGSNAFAEGGMDLVALNGVREDSESDVFFLSFPQNMDTSFRVRIGMPFQDLPATQRLQLWFWVLARAGATLPDLTLAYRIVRRPLGNVYPNCEHVPLPTTDILLPNPVVGCAGESVAVDEYVEAFSDAIPTTGGLVNGDTILATLSRAGSTDGYPGDVGILRMGYKFV